MFYSWRFQLAMILTTVIAAFAVMTSEYNFDASSATLNIALSVGLTTAALFGFSRRGRLPRAVRIIISTVVFTCSAVFVWAMLLDTAHGVMSRAFTMAHMAIIIMGCKYLQAVKTRDYASLFVLTMLLMVVSAITCSSIVMAPIFMIYMILMGYSLILYHLQRQVEIAAATRFIEGTPDPDDLSLVAREMKSWWKQLKHSRFSFTIACVMAWSMLIAVGVFFMFPRLESGSLLGSQFGQHTQGGFEDRIELGRIDRDPGLRQVVARVSVTSDKMPSGDEGQPLYLRCTVLDQYWPCRLDSTSGDIIPARWTRSLLSYLLQQRLAEPPDTVPDQPMLEQDILLGNWHSPCLPGVYPICAVAGLEADTLRTGQLDQVIASNPPPPAYVNYRCLSIGQVSEAQSSAWFRKHLEKLEQYWMFYGTGSSFMGYMMDMAPMQSQGKSTAAEMVGDLASQRSMLMRKYSEAFDLWRQYRQRILPMTRRIETPFDVIRQTLQDPNEVSDPKYLQNLAHVYQSAVQVGKIDRAIAEKIVEYLRNNYSYSLEPDIDLVPKDIDAFDKRDLYDPVMKFLDTPGAAAHCEIFASAMVQLCRSLGLKARIAVGYQAHEYVPEFKYYLVRQRDAHSWVEVYTADGDWLVYDPTPIALPQRGGGPGSLTGVWARMNNYFEHLQYRWLKFSVSTQGRQSMLWADKTTTWLEGLESSTQTLSNGKLADGLKNWFTHQSGESFFALFVRWMIFFCLILNGVIAVREIVNWLIPQFVQYRIHRRDLEAYTAPNILFYRRMLEILLKIHIYKNPSLTPREFAFDIIRHDPALAPVGRLSELYYKIRFGSLPVDEPTQQNIDAALNQLTIFSQSIRKTIRRPWAWEIKEEK
jgi:hypothetical protein